ncbi:MAG: hypothetical protein KGS46_20055, partial [Chloroflexi bacterium]|nr:hypothetical protein [Chloroflexota bacterium]
LLRLFCILRGDVVLLFFHTLCFTTGLNNIPTFRLNYRALLLDKKEYLFRNASMSIHTQKVHSLHPEILRAQVD